MEESWAESAERAGAGRLAPPVQLECPGEVASRGLHAPVVEGAPSEDRLLLVLGQLFRQPGGAADLAGPVEPPDEAPAANLGEPRFRPGLSLGEGGFEGRAVRLALRGREPRRREPVVVVGVEGAPFAERADARRVEGQTCEQVLDIVERIDA